MDDKRFQIIGKRIGQCGTGGGSRNTEEAIAYFVPKNNKVDLNVSISIDSLEKTGIKIGDFVVFAYYNNAYYLIRDSKNGLKLSTSKNNKTGYTGYRAYVNFKNLDPKSTPLTFADLKNSNRISLEGYADENEKAYCFPCDTK